MILAMMLIAAMMPGGANPRIGPAEADSGAIVSLDAAHIAAVSVSPSGAIFLLDRRKNEVQKYSNSDSLLAHAGGYGWGTIAAFDAPLDVIAVSDLQVFVADYGNHRIVEFDGNLNFISTIDGDLQQNGNRVFGYPKSVAFDRFGAAFIVDGENIQVVKLDNSRRLELTFGGATAGKGQLRSPSRIRVGDNDRVYVHDGGWIMVYDVFGNFLQQLPLPDSGKSEFTVFGSDLYILHGASVRRIAGSGDSTIVLPVQGQPSDIAVAGKTVYLLYPQGVRAFPVADLWPNIFEH